jgi:hypothetical protein
MCLSSLLFFVIIIIYLFVYLFFFFHEGNNHAKLIRDPTNATVDATCSSSFPTPPPRNDEDGEKRRSARYRNTSRLLSVSFHPLDKREEATDISICADFPHADKMNLGVA